MILARGQPHPLDLHPHRCDCPACGDCVDEPSLGRTLANCVVAADDYFDIDDEGLVVLLKTEVPDSERTRVEEAARAAQQKADQVAAQAKSQVTRLPENVKTIGLIIGGSIVATIVFNSIGNALS